MTQLSPRPTQWPVSGCGTCSHASHNMCLSVCLCRWFEQDPDEYVGSVRTCLDEVAKQVNPKQLKGIGITNQRETTVLWDKRTGKPLHPSLIWSDGRTAAIVKRMIERTPSKSKDELRVRMLSCSPFSLSLFFFLHLPIPYLSSILDRPLSLYLSHSAPLWSTYQHLLQCSQDQVDHGELP